MRNKKTPFITNLIGLLLGALILSLVLFRSNLFFSQHFILSYCFNIFFATGLLLLSFFSFKLLKIGGHWGIVSLILIEILSLLKIKYEVKNQTKLLFNIPGKSFIYGNMANTIQFDESISQFNDKIGYKYRPSIKTRFEQWEFKVKTLTTNSFGLRDDEASLIKPKVISLGDSFCTGWGVEQNQTYTDIIEKQLNITCLNAGMSSYGTIREGLMLKSLDRDSLKLVILQYCLNDFKENKTWADSLSAGETFAPSYDENEYKRRVTQNNILRSYFPFRYIFEILREGCKEIFKLQSIENNFGNKNTIFQQREYFIKSLNLIREFYAGPILVISLSNSPQRLDPLIIENARIEAQNTQIKNVTFLNLQEVIGPNDHYYFDGHLKKSGHQKVARELINYIEENPI